MPKKGWYRRRDPGAPPPWLGVIGAVILTATGPGWDGCMARGQSVLSRPPATWGAFVPLDDRAYQAILRGPQAEPSPSGGAPAIGQPHGTAEAAQGPDSPLGAEPLATEGGAALTAAPPGAEPVPLAALFQMVEQGRGHGAYPLLVERFPQEMARSKERGENPELLERRYLVQLLRAGEAFAPPPEVEGFARRFVTSFPDDEGFPLAFFYLTRALYDQRKALETSFFFDERARESLPPWMQTDLLRMQATALLEAGNAPAAAEALLRERAAPGTLHRTTVQEVREVVEKFNNPHLLEQFLEKNPGEDWLAAERPFLLVRTLINGSHFSRALLEMDRIQREAGALAPTQVKALHAAAAEIRERLLATPGKIGVLLPLGSTSGTLRELAFEVLDGLRMRVQFPGANGDAPPSLLPRRLARDIAPPMERPGVQPRNGSGPGVELVVMDTANNPAQAALMVEHLVREEKVSAIIGPIARGESTEAARRAEELGVPLISMSVTMEIPEGARFVFRHSKSQQEEIRDLVRYARDYADARRFAVLYPETSYGQQVSQLFWDEVSRQGGRVVGMESYQPGLGSAANTGDVVGFKQLFGRLTGQTRPIGPEEQALLALLDEETPDPIVDFDALFIPVGPNGSQELRLIAPYPVTVDAEKVLLLGSRFWNNDAVVVAGQGKLDGAVFVDAYDRASVTKEAREFRRRHLTMFGHRTNYAAPSFFTALGYDTLAMVNNLLQDPKNRPPGALAEALATMAPYPGITGLSRFRENGEGEKESIFFTIRDERVLRLEP